MRVVVWLLALVAVGLGGWVLYQRVSAPQPSTYRTANPKRGDLISTISATGTVEPEEIVDVGAQVNGKIAKLGRDPGDESKTVDFRSVVEEGTILAEIDDAVYRAQMEQAKASVLRGEADIIQLKAKLLQTENEWKRAESLRPSKAISDTDYDIAASNFHVAKANVGVGEASLEQLKAALRMANTNLDYTVIKSPVRGTIIDRKINVGQTVVSAMNAPSLFLIAKDLRRMQVKAAVNEADIGEIKNGMPVRFTVDAHPKREFKGTVTQIRLNATTSQNVVTYTVIVSTDNEDLSLLPYLTANVRFETDRHADVWQVPNAALRWKPRNTPEVASKDSARAPQKPEGGSKAGERGGKKPDAGAKESDRGKIWIKEGENIRPLDVRVGITDGTMTEISAKDLSENMDVVLAEIRPQEAAGVTNPFAPPAFPGGSKSGMSRPAGPK